MHLSLKGSLNTKFPRFKGILDIYAGASAAYSLRKLASGISRVVRVRRASDNSEKDFPAADVSSGAMTQWVNAQIVPPLDVRELVDGERTGALIPAAAAYSLRNLSTSYTGNVVDVRRSSDDAEESFTAAEVADGTLVTWVGAGNDGFVTQWYDQTGEAADPENITGFTVSDGTYTNSYTQVADTNGKVAFRSEANEKIFWDAEFNNWLLIIDNAAEITYTSSEDTTYPWDVTSWTGSGGTPVFSSFVGGSPVATGNHVTQGTPANQPKIVDAGSLISGGIEFDGVDDGLFTTGNLTDTLQSATIFALTQDDVTSGTASMVRIRPNGALGAFNGVAWEKASGDTYGSNTLIEGDNGAVTAALSGQGTRSTSKNLNTLVYQQSQILAYENGALDETLNTVGTGSAPVGDVTLVDQLWLGQNFDDNARPFNGTMSEVIVYFTDQSDNRTAFEANIGETYGIDLPSGVDTGYDEVDGFVETWYDQSGNSNDAVQQVSGSQPKIVDAGSLVTDANGKPEMDFDGVNDWFTLGVSQLGNTEFFADSSDSWFVTGVTTYDYGTFISKAGVSGPAREFQIFYFEGTNSTYTRGSRTNLSSDVNQRLVSYNWDGANAVVGLNGTLNAVSVGTASKTSQDINIGARTNGQFLLNGSLQEIIIYDSDQSANRAGIEDNINNQYDIY